MTATTEPPRSKGAMMVAAYRAARLNQRPTLRSDPHQLPGGRRLGRDTVQIPPELARSTWAEPNVLTNAALTEDSGPVNVFANLVSMAAAERSSVEPREPLATQSVGTPAPAPTDPASGLADHSSELSSSPTAVVLGPPPKTSCLEPAAVTDTPMVSRDADTAQPAHNASISYDPPLAQIGFGPGMLIRLSQLGLHTMTDLAQADAAQLRAALGEISRLVDVETWITNARQTIPDGTDVSAVRGREVSQV